MFLNNIQLAANTWATDAGLVALASDRINPQGEASNWAYMFYSPSLDDFRVFGAFGNIVLPSELEEKMPGKTVGLTVSRISQ